MCVCNNDEEAITTAGLETCVLIITSSKKTERVANDGGRPRRKLTEYEVFFARKNKASWNDAALYFYLIKYSKNLTRRVKYTFLFDRAEVVVEEFERE